MKKNLASNFKELPKYKITWWVMVLGLAAVIEIPLLGYLNQIILSSLGKPYPQTIGFTGIGLTIIALVLAVISYRKRERSWVLWLGLSPAFLLSAFWLVIIIAEIFSIIFDLGF